MSDLLVIGGGINGAGVARDAAGRGLSVTLVEQDDIGGATSSCSSKLVHGGLRYLEQRQFRLVRESLAEREILLATAGHLVRPMRFLMPHAPRMRGALSVRAGLMLYDWMARGTRLPASRRAEIPAGLLKEEYRKAWEYSDCWADDARLVLATARSAAEKGAQVLPRTAVVNARREAEGWAVALYDRERRHGSQVQARVLVNAAGPWVRKVLDGVVESKSATGVRLVKGSHIVVRRAHEHDLALLLQNEDRRVVFVIPLESEFSVIGTTDVPVDEPDAPSITEEETDYLCRAASRFLSRPVSAADVVWSYSGVRPLFDDGSPDPSTVSRDYVLELEDGNGRAPLLTVFGGKLTTYRRLAEKVMEKLLPYLPGAGGPWTAGAPLPGGDGDMASFATQLARQYPWVPDALRRDLVRRHGTDCAEVLGDGHELGAEMAPGLVQREVDYFIEREWARTADDVLWRRTKAGLSASEAQRAALEDYIASRRSG